MECLSDLMVLDLYIFIFFLVGDLKENKNYFLSNGIEVELFFVLGCFKGKFRVRKQRNSARMFYKFL